MGSLLCLCVSADVAMLTQSGLIDDRMNIVSSTATECFAVVANILCFESLCNYCLVKTLVHG